MFSRRIHLYAGLREEDHPMNDRISMLLDRRVSRPVATALTVMALALAASPVIAQQAPAPAAPARPAAPAQPAQRPAAQSAQRPAAQPAQRPAQQQPAQAAPPQQQAQPGQGDM